MLILSEDSLRVLVTGSGTVVIHAGQFHEKLAVEEASLVYSVGVTLPHLTLAFDTRYGKTILGCSALLKKEKKI